MIVPQATPLGLFYCTSARSALSSIGSEPDASSGGCRAIFGLVLLSTLAECWDLSVHQHAE